MANRMGVLSVLVALGTVCCFAAPAPAFEPTGFTTLFRAGQDAGGGMAVLLNEDQCALRAVRGTPCLDIVEETDPYEPVAWSFSISAPEWFATGRRTLRVTYIDDGAGLIAPQALRGEAAAPDYARPVRQRSQARLNTGILRHAWFEFDLGDAVPRTGDAAHLRITGLQHLVELRMGPPLREEDWEAVGAAIPRDVKPMITLNRPMELVTTAGVTVGERGPEDLRNSLEGLAEIAPLARVLGFTSIESYVIWRRLEPEAEGRFDFSFYDAVVEKLGEYGLKWYPLLVVGSAYALPDWFRDGPEDIGFVCLEHGIENPIQSIWSPHHARHVTRVLRAFGEHYDGTGVLEGVRLGPSGNYGESQYPAGGNWGYRNQAMHIHIGWWAGDPYAQADFRRWLKEKYRDIGALNAAWDGADYAAFDEVTALLPQVIRSRRQRLDLTAWYTDSMSAWCAWWAREARRFLPNTTLYQSAGGWGFREAGTDYSAQTKAMADLGGGIRLTNETDSYEQCYFATRLATTAARCYGAPIGVEPASSHTARGVAGRLYNLIAVNGDHFFTYQSNIFNQPMAIQQWLRYLPQADHRQPPIVEVALYYPETMNQLEDATFRHLYAWGFNPRAREIRRVVDVDYLDETLIREGFLDRYKALVFVWGNVIEADVLEHMDDWVRRGGLLLYPSFPRGDLETVEGDASVFRRWMQGDTGAGIARRFRGDMEPPELYARFVRDNLLETADLHPWVQAAVTARFPAQVFLTVQQDGHLLALNYDDRPASLQVQGLAERHLSPWEIQRIPLNAATRD